MVAISCDGDGDGDGVGVVWGLDLRLRRHLPLK